MVCNELIIGQRWCIGKIKNDSVKHHITYFPEKTIIIHKKCHSRKKLSPLGLIQYSRAEYYFFYEQLYFLGYSLPLPIFEKKKRKGQYGKIIHNRYNPNYDKYLKPLFTR